MPPATIVDAPAFGRIETPRGRSQPNQCGALSDLPAFSTPPCTAEGRVKEASHTSGTLPPGGFPGNPPRGPPCRSAALN